ncbi:hypothetical protein DMH04_56035 [Kibdelosporangium aridum]|uniref:Uncharacterized protein n=1 Tax=Kibdelosporangium aridum TaxID=2030 RepID=A0A428XTE4_KIBAR|nr:hypothetical protein DMH04_56035 [Kibdelosporangium aridum]
MIFGAAGAGAVLLPSQWTADARTIHAQAADDLALWYDKPAGAEWLRVLPIGNGDVIPPAWSRS